MMKKAASRPLWSVFLTISCTFMSWSLELMVWSSSVSCLWCSCACRLRSDITSWNRCSFTDRWAWSSWSTSAADTSPSSTDLSSCKHRGTDGQSHTHTHTPITSGRVRLTFVCVMCNRLMLRAAEITIYNLIGWFYASFRRLYQCTGKQGFKQINCVDEMIRCLEQTESAAVGCVWD